MNYKIKTRQYKISKITGEKFKDEEFLSIYDYIENNILNTKIYCAQHSYFFFNQNETKILFFYDWWANDLHISRVLESHFRNEILKKLDTTARRVFIGDVFKYHYKFIDQLSDDAHSSVMFFLPTSVKDMTTEDVRKLM